MDYSEIILKTLDKAGEPLRPGDIANLAGLDRKDTDKAIKELKKGERIYSPKRCFWAVK